MSAKLLEELNRELGEAQRRLAEATNDVNRLLAAKAALEGKAAAPAAGRSGPTVPDMVLECCRDFASRHAPKPGMGLVIQNENIVEAAGRLFPSSVRKIKNGLCNAVKKWVANGKLRRVAGGLELVS